MRLWTKSRLIFNTLCDNAKQRMRQRARQTGMAKRSVHRLTQASERRDCPPESWWWETEDGALVNTHSAPLGWRSTYFPRGIFRTHSTPQQWSVVVA